MFRKLLIIVAFAAVSSVPSSGAGAVSSATRSLASRVKAGSCAEGCTCVKELGFDECTRPGYQCKWYAL